MQHVQSLEEAHTRMMRLVTTKQGVIEQQFVQHWYDILESTL